VKKNIDSTKYDMRDFAFFTDFYYHEKSKNSHMVLKWFKRPHFELQTKVQVFEESI
jgi:hypothetical protein